MPFFSDTFTDTNGVDLGAHTPTLGTSWVPLSGSEALEIQSNRVQAIGNFGVNRYSAGNAPGANYEVQVTLVHNIQSGWAGHVGGVFARAAFPGAGSMALTSGYQVKWSENDNVGGANGSWTLTSWSGGTEGAALGTYADAWTSGTRTVKLTLNGTSLVVNIDGTNRISITDATYSVAGVFGILHAGGLLDGVLLDDFSASVLSAPDLLVLIGEPITGSDGGTS